MAEKRRRPDAKFKVMHNVFDHHTNRILFKLISEGHFDGLESAVKMGKEANIFSAMKGKKRIMVKIYRLEACDFNKMFEYIREDPRYLGLGGKKRKIIFHWVQREFKNLMKARKAEVNVPKPIKFSGNVLLLEFVGDGDDIAPMLKDKKPKDPKKFLDLLVKDLKKLYKAGFVHADLSAFNILNHNEKPVIIDFSQATTTRNLSADRFLDRDIKNIAVFFKKVGLKVDEEKLKKKIKS